MLRDGAGLGMLGGGQPVVGLGSERDPPEAHALQTPTPTSCFVSVCPQTGKTKEISRGSRAMEGSVGQGRVSYKELLLHQG